MKIKLNVRVNFTREGKTFTVWARPHQFLPGLEFYSGVAEDLSEAIFRLMSSLPETFQIDDDFCVASDSLEYSVIRPFEVVRSQSIRIFNVT